MRSFLYSEVPMKTAARPVLADAEGRLTTSVMKQCAEEMARKSVRTFLNKSVGAISEHTGGWLKERELWVPGMGTEFAFSVIMFLEGRTLSDEPFLDRRRSSFAKTKI